MNVTHYPTNDGASSLASLQLQLSSQLLMIRSRHLKLEMKCVPFFDLRKAFDSVPHRSLLDKLAGLGFDDHTLSWITS